MFMNIRLLVVLLFLVYTCPAVAQKNAVTWKTLFNGKDLSGWNQKNGQAKYSVDHGEIVGTTVANTPNSFLCTNEEYGDFILELELKVEGEMNSGIQFRSLSKLDYQNNRVHGYQMEVDPTTADGLEVYMMRQGAIGFISQILRKEKRLLRLVNGIVIVLKLSGQPFERG